VVVTGRNMADSSAYMDKLREQFDQIAALRDTQLQQSLHYPTVQVTLDRERAGLSGVTARDIGQSLIAATYSSRYTARNFWRDDVSGNSYQVQVQVPQPKMTEATDVALVPLTTQSNRQQAAKVADSPSNPTPPLLIRDVARVMRSEMPGEVDRYNMRRYLSMTSNIEGEDLGRVINRLDLAMSRAGRPPRGVEVDLRGQVRPMREMFRSLEIGLAVAVIVILIMLTAYFQAPRLAVTAVASVPAVLCGVVLALWITKTTLNIESLMGTIMAVGVAVSNAIMLVSFGDRHRREAMVSSGRRRRDDARRPCKEPALSTPMRPISPSCSPSSSRSTRPTPASCRGRRARRRSRASSPGASRPAASPSTPGTRHRGDPTSSPVWRAAAAGAHCFSVGTSTSSGARPSCFTPWCARGVCSAAAPST